MAYGYEDEDRDEEPSEYWQARNSLEEAIEWYKELARALREHNVLLPEDADIAMDELGAALNIGVGERNWYREASQ